MLSGFFWGLLLGGAFAAVVFAITTYWMRRPIATLERRAIQAERLAEIGSLTGGLAHEIKNPLSTIQLNLQLLQEDLLPENPAYTRLSNRLRICERETGRLREILDDF